MKLWIRSQDKRTLINTRRIDVDDNNIIIWDEGKYASEIFCGRYKNQERALEVLNEIQTTLLFSETGKLKMTGEAELNLETNNVIYTMPQE